jgi:carbohydrate kinase (thermoresistant glucokinase family)
MSKPSGGRHIVVMGVSGAGKTQVGSALAALLQVPFTDADGLHPAANVEKMSAGIPLTDEDRWPWLAIVGAALADSESLVVACSALKRSYRDAIRATAPDTVFVHLTVDRATLAERVAARPGHFMPVSLLDSQLETLEPLGADELGIALESAGDVAATAERVAAELVSLL